jgi:hypothetical protein
MLLLAVPRYSGYLLGAIVPLQRAAALRHLTLQVMPDHESLKYLPLLTQLRELELTDPWDDPALAYGDPCSAPLARMENLAVLKIRAGFQLSEHTAQSDAELPQVLPPNLTRLEVSVPACQLGAFWRQVAACSLLVELEVYQEVEEPTAADHPSWMLCILAEHLHHLKKLVLQGRAWRQHPVNYMPEVLLALASTEAGQQQQQEHGCDWQQPPVLVFGGERDLCNVVVPPPNMGSFPALQDLQVPFTWLDGWWLLCSAPHHWRALAACTALQRLESLQASCPPPAGVKFAGITFLLTAVGTSPGDTIALLGAFPALRELELKLCPAPAAVVSSQTPWGVEWNCVTTSGRTPRGSSCHATNIHHTAFMILYQTRSTAAAPGAYILLHAAA